LGEEERSSTCAWESGRKTNVAVGIPRRRGGGEARKKRITGPRIWEAFSGKKSSAKNKQQKKKKTKKNTSKKKKTPTKKKHKTKKEKKKNKKKKKKNKNQKTQKKKTTNPKKKKKKQKQQEEKKKDRHEKTCENLYYILETKLKLYNEFAWRGCRVLENGARKIVIAFKKHFFFRKDAPNSREKTFGEGARKEPSWNSPNLSKGTKRVEARAFGEKKEFADLFLGISIIR